MEGGALFNPGFIGGSFIWWLGQIADNSSWRNNEQPGKFETAEQIKGFGKRYKVRIIGVHDKEEEKIKSDQLPWANIMYPVTAGAGQGDSFQTANLRQGMFVFGFYMDGQDMQVPVIMGVLGNNAQTELHTKIGNNDSNFAGTSGFAQGQEDIKGPAKSIPKDEGKGVTKPKPANVANEQAALSGQQETTSQGLPKTNPTKEQQRDLESAKAEVESMDSSVKVSTFGSDNPSQAEIDQYIKEKVTQGMEKRVDFANSPGSPAQPGATLEGTGSMMQVAAADIKLEDKYNEKTVVIVPDKVVESAIKAIQTISENLTAKMEKSLSSLGNYADAVSGAPSPDDMQKLIKDAACQMAKYMKIIMDKIMEYSNKNLKEELSETLSEMPSCMRYQMGDMMNVMNEKSLEQYNNITETICGQLEGTLSQSLDVPSLIAATEKKVAENVGLTTVQRYQNPITGTIVERTVSLPPTRTHPDVPMCSAESIVGTSIANVKGQIDDANNKNVEGVSRYLEDLNGELERMDAAFKERADDDSLHGAMLEITDEEVMDEVRGGTLYKTMTEVGIVWKTSTISTRQVSAGFGTDQATGQGALVDIVVPRGGLGKDGNGQSIDFTWISNGTGYPNPSGNQLNVSGGTGTGMKVNVQANASGVITNMFTHTVGTGYKLLDDNQEPYIYTIQSGNFDAKFKLDAVWGPIENGGIKVNKRGIGYVEGDVYAVLNGSGDATFMVISVHDEGNGKAESADPKPLELGSMISKLPGLSGNGSGGAAAMPGNLTSALDFKNIAADIFPFELPPNASPVDFVTLANGGEGQTDSEIPNMDSIRNNIANNVGDVSEAIEGEVPFLTPKTKQVIDLVEGKVKPS
jgi:hypothetical protein